MPGYSLHVQALGLDLLLLQYGRHGESNRCDISLTASTIAGRYRYFQTVNPKAAA